VNGPPDAVRRAFDALLLKARVESARAPTVATVAARASISRSSMYRFHIDVIARRTAQAHQRDKVA
jgi:hypothetical protein